MIIKTTKEKLLANEWKTDNGWDYKKETNTGAIMELNQSPSILGEYRLHCHDVDFPTDLIAIGEELLKVKVK